MLGIIGGTGLYDLDTLKNVEHLEVETPFGKPSDKIVLGEIEGKKIAFLPRHGSHHSLIPSEINFRANIYALKSIGVTSILSVSAVGSLREEMKPGDFVLVDQYVDFTKGKREGTFFGNGITAHASTAEPSSHILRELLLSTAPENTFHPKGTYVCVEGPRLGTKAESLFFKNNGFDLVGMTNVPESFLAREAQICYQTMAIVTDYDCWKDDPNSYVSVEQVIARYKKSISGVKKIIEDFVAKNNFDFECPTRKSMMGAIMTPENLMNDKQKKIIENLLK